MTLRSKLPGGRERELRRLSFSPCLGSILALLTMVALAACGSGQPAGESRTAGKRDLVNYFGQKPFTIVVNYKVGGSTDAWVRMFARHLGRYLPGQPTVIIDSRPGGSGLVGPKYLETVPEKDGLTIGAFGGGLVREQAMGVFPIDLRKLGIIAVVGDSTVTYGRKEVFPKGYKSALSPANLPFFIGHAEKDDAYVRGYIYWNFLGLEREKDFRQLIGYDGDAARLHAMQQGEIDFADNRVGGYKKTVLPFVEDGLFVPMWQNGVLDQSGKPTRHPGLPEIPTFAEVVKELKGNEPEGRLWDFLLWQISADSALRILVTPSDCPADVLEAIRSAFRTTLADPAYLEQQEQLMGTWDQIHAVGDQAEKIIDDIINTVDKVMDVYENILSR